ncbi:MAG: dihydroorotate dehydrogenase electron transfer subunit [Planctomycetota bacterium]
MHLSNPDHICQETVAIEEHVPIARDTYRLRLPCSSIAAKILPGQFMMLRLPGTNDPLLGRPLALYDTYRDASGQPKGVDIVYQVVGRMTRRLAAVKVGDWLTVWGPLGNGFPPTETGHLIMVAGGIGQTPFLALARHYLGRGDYGQPPLAVPRAQKVTLCYGLRSAAFMAGVDDFRRLGVEVLISTDDGSAGHCGTVIELVPPVVDASSYACRIVTCGPEKMLHATSDMATRMGLPCQVSLESPMACGIGICFSCVTKIRDPQGEWDYRRVCVEGPIFNAADVEF